MITSRSRYAASTVEKRAVGDEVRQTILYPSSKALSTQFTYHQWISADRLDLLASAYFNDVTLWWMIARANPEILDWHDIPPGAVIRIPSG